VYSPIVARHQLCKNVTWARNIHNNRIIVGHTVFCVVCVLSKEKEWFFQELLVVWFPK
jgi:hypothetical protein